MRFETLGLRFVVHCTNAPAAADVISINYAAMAVALPDAAGRLTADPADATTLHYRIAGDSGTPEAFTLACPGRPPQSADSLYELLFLIEKHLTVALQEHRPDLLFFHAAVLERRGRAFLIAGDSGHGKSTTAWGLLHHGFRYLSDELAPVEPGPLQVHAYPHALCMKRRPPAAYPWAEQQVLDLHETLHVPVAALPAGTVSAPLPLAALLFVHYEAGRGRPSLEPVGSAEAAARLYLNTLNALAHPARGLDPVLRMAREVPAFRLQAGDLAATCELVGRLADADAPAGYPKG